MCAWACNGVGGAFMRKRQSRICIKMGNLPAQEQTTVAIGSAQRGVLPMDYENRE
jgi:hypothetical protein